MRHMTEPKLSYTPFDYANLTAKWLLEIGAVEYRADPPFTWTSGRETPIYVDVRKVLGSRYRARAEINAMSCNKIYETIGSNNFDFVAGGETDAIPFSTMI